MVNPFAVLGLPESFDLDAQELHGRYITLSAAAHPDRFPDPLDQADAAQRAAEINEAYRALADPELRAGALLELWGGAGKEADKALPPGLLGQMMETREELDAARAAGDKATLARLRRWAQQKRQDHLTRIGDLFRQVKTAGDATGAGETTSAGETARQVGDAGIATGNTAARSPLLGAIRLELNGLRYIQRMIEQTPG